MNPTVALAVPVWSNLTTLKLQRLRLVGHEMKPCAQIEPLVANLYFLAKFTGYQYGGRPLGITFVKYLNAGPQGDAMDGTEPTSGITQDQIM